MIVNYVMKDIIDIHFTLCKMLASVLCSGHVYEWPFVTERHLLIRNHITFS